MKRKLSKYEDINSAFLNAIEVALEEKVPQEIWKKDITKCLDQGADIDCPIGECCATALMSAIESLQKNLFEFLIKKGANVNATDRYGFTPLHILADKLRHSQQFFDIPMFEELLKRGANLHARTKITQENPLSWLARFGTDELMKIAIQYIADINKKDAVGCTPLAHAILNKKYGLIKILCEAGALLTDIDDFTKGSAFHLAIGLPKKNIENIMIHAHCNYFKEIYPEQKQRMNEIIETLCVFKQIGISKEIIFLIFSKFLPEYFINEKFCKELLHKGYKLPYIFYQTNKQVICLKTILQESKNCRQQTAAEFLLIEQNYNPNYINKVKNLLNGEQLIKNMEAFRVAFPDKINELDKNNLAFRIGKKVEEKIGIRL